MCNFGRCGGGRYLDMVESFAQLGCDNYGGRVQRWKGTANKCFVFLENCVDV